MRALILGLGLAALAASALAADQPPVPAEMQAAWSTEGHCNTPSQRLEIGAFRAGYENGHQGAVHYDEARRSIVWDDPAKIDTFVMAPQGKLLIHRLDGTPRGERETYVRCPNRLIGRRR